MAQLVKTPPAMWETWVQTLGWENPLEKGKAAAAAAAAKSLQSWRIPWIVYFMGSQRVRHD